MRVAENAAYTVELPSSLKDAAGRVLANAGAFPMKVSTGDAPPIANGILTCETDEQAEVRMQPKGSDCAQAAVEMANLQKALDQ